MKGDNKLLGNCKKGNHQYDIIFRAPGLFGASDVVRWCNICGSVVVDVDVDGRTRHGETMKMKTPAIAKVSLGGK